jgi:hypothetical protein
MAKKPTPKPRQAPTPDTSAAAAAVAPRDRAAARPRTPDTDPAKVWQGRLVRANRKFDDWEKEFECKRLDKYYRGKQWHGLSESEAQKRYVINLVFATLETQLPSLLFSQPKVKVEARPDHQQTANSDASARATLIEQTLQTFLEDPKVAFTFETTLALRDAYPRYGIVEVGYTADYIDNPNAGKPVLKEDSDEPMVAKDGKPVLQPGKTIRPGSKESLYVRRLRPGSVRVFPGRNRLEANDWVAYYEWHHTEDVQRNRDYQHTDGLKATGRLATVDDEDITSDPDTEAHVGMVKIWKIFDLRRKVRHVLADGHKQLLQADRPFTALPLADLKFFELADEYYPLPPIFNWLSPQDEYNETREGMRNHRRRFARRYMREPSVKATEFEKLETGEDGVCIEVPKVNPPPIVPIQDADLSAANTVQELAATKDDFGLVAGVSGEQRGVPESKTATQANIVNVRTELRETRARAQVAAWLGDIARLMLVTIREHMQLAFMVKQTIDPFAFSTDPEQLAKRAETWQEITSEDVSELDVDIKIDVASLSPVAEEAQRNAWNVVLQLLTNPPLLMILMTPIPQAPNEPSPLLRKTLALHGIKSDQEVREIWRVGQEVLKQMQMMTLATAASKGGMPGLGMLMGGGMGSPPAPAKHPTGHPTPGAMAG